MQIIKRYLLLTMLVGGWVNVCSAKVAPDRLAKAKDFLNNRITWLVLQEYVNVTEKGSEAFKKKLSDVKPAIYKKEVSDAIGYEELSKTLDKDFHTAVGKISILINKIDESKLSDSSVAIAAQRLSDMAFAQIAVKYKAYEAAILKSKPSLQDAITTYFNEAPAAQITGNPDTPVEKAAVAAVVQKVDTVYGNDHTSEGTSVAVATEQAGFFSGSRFSFWDLLSILLCLVTAGFVVWALNKMGKRIHQLKQNQLFSNKETLEAVPVVTLKTERKELERQLSNSEVIQNLSREIADLKLALTAKNKPAVAPPPVQPVAVNPPPVNEDIFFMAGPVGNYFPAVAKSLTKDNTVYRFMVKGNKQEASYEIHTTGAPVNEIVSMIESYIKPACNEENLPNFKVTNIKTTTPGLASLEGDRWVIKTKAMIRYE